MKFKGGLKLLFAVLALFFVVLFVVCLDVSDKTSEKYSSDVPRIGQKLWSYNIKNHGWQKYSKHNYSYDVENEIILQIQQDSQSPEVTSYNIITSNSDISGADLFLGEGSREFLIGDKLYTYFPRRFQYYEIVFNGFNFVLRKLSSNEISKIFEEYNVISLSEFNKRKLNLKYSKEKRKYIILNDVGEDFYMYYITSLNDNEIKIGTYSNQFEVLNPVNIKLQRIEGCTKFYPCYEINIIGE